MAAKIATIIPPSSLRKKKYVHRSVTQQARRLQSVDYIGEGESLVQVCKRTCNFGRRIPVQPECMVVVYDITFFATFFIGNVVTLIWNPKFMSDNPIMNYFRNNNICVGIDSYPARYAAIPIACLSVVFFFLACFLYFKRMWDEDRTEHSRTGQLVRIYDKSKWFRGLVLILAMASYSLFGYAVAIPPTANAQDFRSHYLGFLSGLIGLGFLRFSSLLEFFCFVAYERHVDGNKFGGILEHKIVNPVTNCRSLTFLINECALLIMLWGFPFRMLPMTLAIWSTPDDVLFAQITNHTWGPPSTAAVAGFNGLSSVLIIVIFICPIISLLVAPKSRMLEIEFHYNVNEVQHEHVFQICCCNIFCPRRNLCESKFPCCRQVKRYVSVNPIITDPAPVVETEVPVTVTSSEDTVVTDLTDVDVMDPEQGEFLDATRVLKY